MKSAPSTPSKSDPPPGGRAPGLVEQIRRRAGRRVLGQTHRIGQRRFERALLNFKTRPPSQAFRRML